ncbi:UNVERIFIED_CONTAM: hypothetical protein PYX00_007389 [Menopon gallinae]|uniref:Alpha-1,6-mannosyl-glycoprotein 2-beta-N-acetylglucosaminyltransferase n=1 Tax=Menopon gallinae TaxID=328185 RepID=A0AAW2HJS3_9NEOP
MRNGRLRIPIPTPSVGRRRSTSCLRTILFLFLVTFVWLQLHMANRSGTNGNISFDANDSTVAVINLVPKVLHKFLTPRPRSANATQDKLKQRLSGNALNITEIKMNIDRYNEMQYIHNEDLFGPLQNDSLIIVVQVHTRITYLRHLIVSLAQAKDIDTVLLVFSHDYYDEEINELVQSIDFCKVMQIFYPYSIQTHPDVFPGASPNDCPRDMKQDDAMIRKCYNAAWPDLYGHYREARFTQTKHHWWWKANRVFSQLEATRHHTGLVLFLEEDHYVVEDFIYLLQQMQRAVKTSCDKCNIYSLGTYLKTFNYYSDSRKMEVTPWISSKHNMGMAMNKTMWMGIRKCAQFFCSYDDYNWDWSLQHVSNQCLSQKLHVVVARGPRIFHIGECGVHHKKRNCEATTVINRVQQVLKFAKKHLFPSRIILVYTINSKKQKIRRGNGGWSDIRDHQLCLNISKVGR